MTVLLRLITVGIILGVLDFAWLGLIAKKLYQKELGDLLAAKPNGVAAGLFYITYVVGIVVFVLTPALDKHSAGYAVGYGAFLGFVAYATYDLTNKATLKHFSTKIVIVDLIWGSFITMAAAGGAYLILR